MTHFPPRYMKNCQMPTSIFVGRFSPRIHKRPQDEKARWFTSYSGYYFTNITMEMCLISKRSMSLHVDYFGMHCITRQIWGIWKLRPAYSPETANLGQIRRFLEPCDLQIWQMTLKNNRAPLQCYFKLCASFRIHWWIQNGYSPKTTNLGQIWRFLEPCDLEIWQITLKNNRAPLQCYFKLCASFLSHWWIQTWVTVRKRPIWVKFDDF